MMKISDGLFSSGVAGKWIKTNCLNDIPVSLSAESAASMIEKGKPNEKSINSWTQ